LPFVVHHHGQSWVVTHAAEAVLVLPEIYDHCAVIACGEDVQGALEAIPGSPFRRMITAADTGGRFSTLSAVLGPGDLVLPHSHRDEDEFSFVFRGRIDGRVADHDVVVEEGGFLFKPRGIVHAIWNPIGRCGNSR
jgi:quercetin dioxygenase-like cupin family protein